MLYIFIMKIFKIYIDTSVFGGVFDQEFSEYSLLLFNKFRKNEYLPVISDITIAELENAPDRVKNLGSSGIMVEK